MLSSPWDKYVIRFLSITCTSGRNRADRITTEMALVTKAVMVEEKNHEQEKLNKAKDLEREKFNKKALEEI